MITRYEVSCLPLDHPERGLFTIDVEYRGRGKWAVARHRRCADAAGVWDYESIPSERRDEWLARYRHDLPDALAIAKRLAPNIRCNGWTAADALAHGDTE